MRKCKPQEIIKSIPEVQTITLPEHWFDDLSDKKDVFNSLYEWMLDKGRVPSENSGNLHGRTYIGEKLYTKLLDAERKRISKKHKIKGNELDRAVNWSDINSGPMTEIGECTITGDVILVIPESSRNFLHDFSFKIFKETRSATINKIKSHAAGATFYQWLVSQLYRPDRIGDSARDAENDENYRRDSNDYGEIKSYLDKNACAAAIESFKEGWIEYIRQYPGRVKSAAWCSDCGQKINIDEAFLAWNSEDPYEIFVLDAECLRKYESFDPMASRPLLGINCAELEQMANINGLSELGVAELEENLKLWGVIPTDSNGYIYFLGSENNTIKIGFTAGAAKERLKALQTGHAHKLKLLAIMPGDRETERELHLRFAKHRMEGEWFKVHPDLIAFISVLNCNTSQKYR